MRRNLWNQRDQNSRNPGNSPSITAGSSPPAGASDAVSPDPAGSSDTSSLAGLDTPQQRHILLLFFRNVYVLEFLKSNQWFSQ